MTLDELVPPQTPVRVATGFVFTEGPVWNRDGSWLFVDVYNNRIHRLGPDGAVSTVRDESHASNGMTLDTDGRLLVCEGQTRQVTRRRPDGSYDVLASRYRGRRLNKPNDIVVRSDGSIYFTDPAPDFSVPGLELDFCAVYRLVEAGDPVPLYRTRELVNGLAFSPDENRLYVAISRRDPGCAGEKARGEVCVHQRILVFEVMPDGRLGPERTFAVMASSGDGLPDGLKVSETGHVFCAGAGGCWVFDPAGVHIGTLVLPEIPANLAWGGPDRRTLLFAARTSLYTMRTAVAGAKPPVRT